MTARRGVRKYLAGGAAAVAAAGLTLWGVGTANAASSDLVQAWTVTTYSSFGADAHNLGSATLCLFSGGRAHTSNGFDGSWYRSNGNSVWHIDLEPGSYNFVLWNVDHGHWRSPAGEGRIRRTAAPQGDIDAHCG